MRDPRVESRGDTAATGIDVSGAASPTPLMRERSIATAPIAELLSQTSRDRELTSGRVAVLSDRRPWRGPVGTIDRKKRRIFSRATWLKFHGGSTRFREECGSSSDPARRRLAHVISRGTASELCANRGPAPSSRDLLIFFFSIRASRTIEQRLASTTRFRIVVCGRSTSPKRKVARTATVRSHHTPCLYRYARGTRLQVDPETTWRYRRSDRFTWHRRWCGGFEFWNGA